MKNFLMAVALVLTGATAFAGGDKGPIDVVIGPSTSYACVARNQNTGYSYVRKSSSRSFAQSSALDYCLNNSRRGRACSNARCAQETNGLKRVVVENGRTGQRFRANAYSRIEARAIAMNRCLNTVRNPSRCYVVR